MSGDTSTVITRAAPGVGLRTPLVSPDRPGERPEDLPTASEPFSLALQSLLSTVSTPTPDGLRTQGSATSLSQMFEPNRGAGHAGRLASLKADARSSTLRDPGRLHVNRGSIQERAAGTDRPTGAGKPTPSTSLDIGPQSSGPKGSTASESVKPLSLAQARESAGAASKERFQLQANGQGVSKGEVHPSRPVSDRGTQPSQGSNSGLVNRPQGPASSEVVNGSRGSDKTVAQQVARALSGGRTSAMETVRPLAGSSGTNTTRDPQIAKKATDASMPRDARSLDELGGQKAQTTSATRSDFDRMVRSIRLQTGSGFSSAKLLLDPPELGRVQVDVRLAGDDLQIAVLVANRDARDLLAERASELRDALARQGINVQSMNIVVKGLGPNSGRTTQTRDSHETDRSRRANRSTLGFGDEAGDSELRTEGLAEWSSQRQSAGMEARLDIEV